MVRGVSGANPRTYREPFANNLFAFFLSACVRCKGFAAVKHASILNFLSLHYSDIRLKFVRLGRKAERLQTDIFLKADVSTARRVYAPNVDGRVVWFFHHVKNSGVIPLMKSKQSQRRWRCEQFAFSVGFHSADADKASDVEHDVARRWFPFVVFHLWLLPLIILCLRFVCFSTVR